MRLPKSVLPFALGLAAAPFLPFAGVQGGTSQMSEVDVVRSFSRTIQNTAREVAPAVVSIEAYLGGLRSTKGSGVVLGKEGLVVTNHHVAGSATNVRVLLSDGRRLDARIKGSDPETDLCVLQIDASETFTALELREEPAQIGEYVLAVGNPLGFDQTVTSGIISARERRIDVATYENFLQTDAAINPGNSGGPLIDLDGKVVGINTAVEVDERGSQGLGFAIPADMVRDVVEEIVSKGRVERGYLGVTVDDIGPRTSENMGLKRKVHVLIRGVEEKGPAARAGIRPGDIVLVIGDRRVTERYDVLETVAEVDPGDKVRMILYRDGSRIEAEVLVGTRPNMRVR